MGCGQVSWGVTGGGCSPVLLRLHPHQLQIKAMDTVTLKEDRAQVSSRAQARRSPTLPAWPCPEHQPAGTPQVSPGYSVQHAHRPYLVATSKAAPPAPYQPRAWPGTWDQPPTPQSRSTTATRMLFGTHSSDSSAPAGNLSMNPAAWGMETSLRSLPPETTQTSPSSCVPLALRTPQPHGHSTLVPS